MKSWPVYFNTKDFPYKFVSREFDGETPTQHTCVAEYIDGVHEWIYQRAREAGQGAPYRFVRDPHDDPVIVESWI